MESCRNCKFSRHDGDNLRCPFRDTPAALSVYKGVCSRASRSPVENHMFDQKCEEYAATCHRYQPDSI